VKEKEEKGSARGSVPVFRVCVCVCVCLLLQDLIQNCLHGVWGEGDMGGHVLRKTTSRDLCGLVCPSRTSERGGEGDCVKEGGGVCLLLQDLVQSCLHGGRAEACLDITH
jgi:hypothetical protein